MSCFYANKGDWPGVWVNAQETDSARLLRHTFQTIIKALSDGLGWNGIRRNNRSFIVFTEEQGQTNWVLKAQPMSNDGSKLRVDYVEQPDLTLAGLVKC